MTTCMDMYKQQNCQCYTVEGKQVCGYIDSDNKLHQCNKGCCKDQCVKTESYGDAKELFVCKNVPCTSVYPCQCYAFSDAANPDIEQVCGYQEKGIFYQCSESCCNGGKGCPGQCLEVPERKAFEVLDKNSDAVRFTLSSAPTTPWVNILFGAVLILLILISTISLL